MPFPAAPGNKVSITKHADPLDSSEGCPPWRDKGPVQPEKDLKLPLEKRKLSTVYERKLKESEHPHTLGRASKARQNGAGMADRELGTSASLGASWRGMLSQVDIQQQIIGCAREGDFLLSTTHCLWRDG